MAAHGKQTMLHKRSPNPWPHMALEAQSVQVDASSNCREGLGGLELWAFGSGGPSR